MRNLIFVFVGMAFSYLSAIGDLSEGAPEGKSLCLYRKME